MDNEISPAPNGAVNGDAPFEIEDIIAEAMPQQRSVRICVNGDLRTLYEDLEQQLEDAVDGAADDSLGNDEHWSDLAKQVEAAAADIERHMRRFSFRSIGPNWSMTLARHTNDQGVIDNVTAFFAEVIAASSVQPKIETEQALRLFQKIAQADIDQLYHTARRANFETTAEVPKSLLASQIREAGLSSTS